MEDNKTDIQTTSAPVAEQEEDYGVGITDAMADEMIRKLSAYCQARIIWLRKKELKKAREIYKGDCNASLRSLTNSKTATVRWATLRAMERIPVLTNAQFNALTCKFTAKEVADGIGCSVSTVNSWRKTLGQLPIRNKWAVKVLEWLKTK